MQTYIGLDLGTGAVKGACWRTDGTILGSASKQVAFLHPQPDWVEIDPLEYESMVLGVIQELAAFSDRPVSGISMAAASGNTMLCDQNGTPVTPLISWLDKRGSWCPPAEWHVREITGWPGIPSFPLAHLEYFRSTIPEKLHTAKVTMNNDWLCWRLCGRHALDFSNATPFYLCNQTKALYEQSYLDYYGISAEQLPELVCSGTWLGKLKPQYCGGNLTEDTAIVAGSFDHPTAARAAGITECGQLLLSCGTSWVGFFPCATRADVPMKALCDPFLSQGNTGKCWGGMLSVASIGLQLENFISTQYGNAKQRYEFFNNDALKNGTAANALALEVIGKFGALLKTVDLHPNKIVFCGGPSEGHAWPVLMKQQLGIDISPSPYRSHTGAVGAAMLALQGVTQHADE